MHGPLNVKLWFLFYLETHLNMLGTSKYLDNFAEPLKWESAQFVLLNTLVGSLVSVGILAMTTGIITISFVTCTGFFSPLGTLTTCDPVLGYRLLIYCTSPLPGEWILIWDENFFFVKQEDFHGIDWFGKSFSLGNLRIFFDAVPRFFSSSVTLYFSFPSSDSCKVNLTIFLSCCTSSF